MPRCMKRRLDESPSSTFELKENESKDDTSRRIDAVAMPSVAQSPPNSESVQGKDDGDSDIEFLLTILPPSPAKKSRTDKEVVPSMQSTPKPSSSRPASPHNDDHDENDSTEVPQQQQEMQFQSDAPNNNVVDSSPNLKHSTTKTAVTWRRSAYLQSLAEICHAILWDARWRVGEERLVSWEREDDLSAVHALARRFVRVDLPAPNTCCCREPECAVRQAQNSTTTTSSCMNMRTEDDANTDVGVVEDENEEAYDRSLNLYCRLYFRKGPFFRVDDLFSKYYSPKQDESVAPVEHTSPSKVLKRTNFFLPKKKEKSNSSHGKFIDSDLLQKQMDAASILLEDLQSLHRMGLFRTFADEEECGRTVGEVKRYGLLRQDEQRQILQMLGCEKKQSSPKTGENLLWKQMSQQPSISSMAAADKKHVLPVVKHVNHTILTSWATSIVLKASKVDYMPTSTLQSLTEMVKTELLEMIGQHPFATCVRHREAPLKTLRRCCRLYLCATSGPGSMRGDGATAWKSLPDSHSKDLAKLPLTQMIPPPGSHCWHTICYPGKDHRFKILSCNFIRAHKPLFLYDENLMKHDPIMVQVFSSIDTFSTWELTVEVRAYVDYLIELRDTLRYNDRRRARQCEGGDDDDVDSSAHDEIESVSIDFFDMLTKAGRERIVSRFLVGISSERGTPDEATTCILDEIEKDVEKVEIGFSKVDISKLHTECDKVLAVIAVISLHILSACCEYSTREIVELAAKRPWMRHLRWEGCLAYILWDAIKTLECKMEGFYELAVKALKVLLFGKSNSSSSLVPPAIPQSTEPTLAPLLLSRRAHGKAYERLTIDCLHILRLQQPKLQQRLQQTKTQGKRKAASKQQKCPTPNEIVAKFSRGLLDTSVPTGRIPFSAARTLAKRLKQPLSVTLANMTSPETIELGHRYSNSTDNVSARDQNKYSEWAPIVDHTVAIALGVDEESVGKRCSYVGFEEGGNETLNVGSLNVEELAKEYYKTGRLPIYDTSTLRGGWVGWHDEGGKVRQLWRILSSASVLGMDFGCATDCTAGNSQESATIFLTPYQSAPFDLHCGAEMNSRMVASRGFYERRKDGIEAFLKHLGSLQPNEVADLVYSSVEARFNYISEIEQSDPTLGRDMQQLRSVSLLAAGLGGKMVSAIFRCFFFDYRHYSGGLPDLTLVRAVSEGALVDLGEWIGEGFAAGSEQGASILEDRDSEFLGCSKVGDSGASATNRFRGQRRADQNGDNSTTKEKLKLPARLELSYKGNPVKVECMFSEVKSQNDRLDARQEDWLNILDKYGNARVCKFGGKDKKAQKKS